MNSLLDTLGLRDRDASVSGALCVRVERERFAEVATLLAHNHHLPLSLLYATDDRKTQGTYGVHAVFEGGQSGWLMLSTALPSDDARYASVTRTVLAAHWYERYAADMFGIVADGHPDPRRLVLHENMPEGVHPLRKDFAWNTRLPHANVPYPMHHVDGEGIYEIPVGPIHAGIIEPGHFRFNVAGERIIALEGKLFFTHKGCEKLLEGKNAKAALPFIERISGDASASHALAFCQAMETLAGCAVPARANDIRTLLCELERITMHVFDIGNIIGNGTGYTVLAAHGFRLREDMMRLSHSLCGNRFWRGMIVPGGCARDLDDRALRAVRSCLDAVCFDAARLFAMAMRSDAVRERLETTGTLRRDAALAYGAVGTTARASGIDRDVRRDHPYASYPRCPFRVAVHTSGDVYARLLVRSEELAASAAIVRHLLQDFSSGPILVPCSPTSGTAIGAVESWRGELLHVVRMHEGVIDRCAVRDPSFCNWPLFGEIGPGNIVPDFPLCNKSLNLSYSGTDL
ncbi:MAG: putative formate hydrogenlyase large subunit [Candidatus Peregrinibacteria bacterium Gr01-1014_25]|nr:MAG: putative formate hydrogenlyase large subunit [Candidatus Peregrinibacteria bacterium Gr01-1014_25]